MNDDELKATVKARYGHAALRVVEGAKSSCCGAAPATLDDPITANLYSAARAGEGTVDPEARDADAPLLSAGMKEEGWAIAPGQLK